MRSLTSDQRAALANGRVKRRFFLWIDALGQNGEPDPVGFWDDVGTVDLSGRAYHGGVVFSISTLSARSDLTIPGVKVTASQIAAKALSLVRGHMIAQRPVEIDIGVFDVAANAVIQPLVPWFRGFIDDCEITTPAAGEMGSIVLACESASRALTRKQTETRSSACLARRAAGDRFYDFTATVGEQTVYFGRAAPVVKPQGGTRP